MFTSTPLHDVERALGLGRHVSSSGCRADYNISAVSVQTYCGPGESKILVQAGLALTPLGAELKRREDARQRLLQGIPEPSKKRLVVGADLVRSVLRRGATK